MPRSKPHKKHGEPVFMVEGAVLNEEAIEKLFEHLGITLDNASAKKIIYEIQLRLGSYPGLVEALDYSQRASDYVQIFTKINDMTEKLRNEIAELEHRYKDQFILQSVKLEDIEQALKLLAETTNSIVESVKNIPSAGAPKNSALMNVILNLRGIFHENYCGESTGRKKQGAFEYKSEKEKNEIRFVETALLYAKIIPVKDSFKKVERYFRDPRCTLK